MIRLGTPVSRIVTYSGDTRIRDVKLTDPSDHDNPLNPHLSQQHYLTHFPKDPKCPVCSECKIQKKQNRKRKKGETFACWKEPENLQT